MGAMPRRYKMNKKSRVVNLDKTRIKGIDITGKVMAIVDFVNQFCRKYNLSCIKGLNIAYLEESDFDIVVSVEIIGLPIHDFQFHLVRSLTPLKWNCWSVCGKVNLHFSPNAMQSWRPQIFMSPYQTFALGENYFKVTCDETGNYEFTAVK